MKLNKDSFKALLAKIKVHAVANEGSEDEFGLLMTQLEVDGTDTLNELTTAESEAIVRKKKVRAQEKKLQDQDIEIEEFKEAQKNDTTQAELKELREYKSTTVKSQIGTFGTTLATISKHANFDKAKKYLKLPEPDADGNYDVTKMDEADLTHNLAELGKLNDLSYFGGNGQDETVDVDGKKTYVKPEGFQDQLDKAETTEDLMRIQDNLN
jgi:hypothetical protein